MPDAGTFFAVVGPSGAGKDTLMSKAETALRHDARYVFAKRYITRPEEAGGEDHHAVSRDEFQKKANEGAFALSWSAHGLCYGVPADVIDLTASGSHVVCNLSRGALPETASLFAHLTVLHVTAPADVLAQRLAGRNREDAHDIGRRLNRCRLDVEAQGQVVEIENVGPVARAAGLFIQALLKVSEERV